MTELEAYKEIVDDCFTLVLNMKDAFHWATADAEDMPADDVLKIVPVVQKYGAHTALLAYAAISRGYDSEHKKLLTGDYWAAKKELQALADTGEILWEQWYDRKEKDEQKQEFDGQFIEWDNKRLYRE